MPPSGDGREGRGTGEGAFSSDVEDLAMGAIRKIEVGNFPAFIVVDDKGNDFFEES